MGREKKRKRSASKTPPVEWETLLVPPVAAAPVGPISGVLPAREDSPKGEPDAEARSSRQSTGTERSHGRSKDTDRESKGPSEREAWRGLVLAIAALNGDPEIKALLADKHPELQRVAEDVGAFGSPSRSMEQSRDATKNWFERGLRGSNRHGPEQRALLCTRLMQELKARAATILAEVGGNALEAATTALRRGRAEEEGPLICALISRELEGSRFDGVWVSRSGPGRYIIGDEDSLSGLPDCDSDGATIDRVIHTAIKVADGKLVIDGFFHKGEVDMNPVKCAIGPFLTVYFEGLSLKEALAKWKEGQERRVKAKAILGGKSGVVVRAAGGPQPDRQIDQMKALAATLPPGWELRESRSKKGQYYYANEALGLSQHERPKA